MFIRKEFFGGLFYDAKNTAWYFPVNQTGFKIIKMLIHRKTEEDIFLKLGGKNKLDDSQKSAIKKFITNTAGLFLNNNHWTDIKIIEPGKIPENYLSAPLFLEMYPSFKCNARCKFCYLSKEGLSRSCMPIENAKIIVDKCVTEGVGEINILGGEPFLWNSLPEFLNYTGEKGISASVTTNGIFDGLNFADKLSKLKMVTTNFSVLGTNPQTHDYLTGVDGSFAKAMKNIDLFLEKGANVDVGITVTSRNKNQVVDIIRMLGKKGISTFGLRFFTACGKGWSNRNDCEFKMEDFWKITDEALKMSKKSNTINVSGLGGYYFLSSANPVPKHDYLKIKTQFCGAGNVKFDVLPEGNSVPCVMFPPSHDLLETGNILTSKQVKISDVWHNPTMTMFRRRNAPEKCVSEKCKYSILCKGGCPAVTGWLMADSNVKPLTFTEVFKKPDPRCPSLQVKKERR